jgi:hypothetical protein
MQPVRQRETRSSPREILAGRGPRAPRGGAQNDTRERSVKKLASYPGRAACHALDVRLDSPAGGS